MSAEPNDLHDRAAIERVIFDYAAAIDQRDYDLLRTCLDDDLMVAFRPGRPEVRFVGLGEDAVRMTANSFIERNRLLFIGFGGTHHQITNIRIDLDGDTARERSYVQAIHFMPDEPRLEYTFGAFYDNRFIRRADGWRRSSVDLTVVWERGDPTMTERARSVATRQQTNVGLS